MKDLFTMVRKSKEPTEYIRLDQCRGDGGKCRNRCMQSNSAKGITREQRGQSIDTPLGVPNGTWTDKTCSVLTVITGEGKHLQGHYQRLEWAKHDDPPRSRLEVHGLAKFAPDGCERKERALCKHYGNRRQAVIITSRSRRSGIGPYYSIPKKYRGVREKTAVVYRIDFLDKTGQEGCFNHRLSGRRTARQANIHASKQIHIA